MLHFQGFDLSFAGSEVSKFVFCVEIFNILFSFEFQIFSFAVFSIFELFEIIMFELDFVNLF